MIFEYSRIIFHEDHYRIENFFLKHTEDRVLKLFLNINSLRRNYNFYVFDISNQNNHIAAQPISVEFRFYETGALNVLDYTGFASVLTNRLVSIGSDGRRMFDLLKLYLIDKSQIKNFT